MLRTQPITVAPPPPAIIITDPVDILARHMVELEAQGRVVTLDVLLGATNLTSGEITRHADAARDRAVELRRARETRS